MAVFVVPKELQELELRICAVITIILFILVMVCLIVITWPILLSLLTPFSEAVCKSDLYETLYGVHNCTWTSCQESCTADNYVCRQLLVEYKLKNNESGVLPLYASVLGCGFEFGIPCQDFYDNFTQIGSVFDCHVVFHEMPFAIPAEQDIYIKLLEYFGFSLTPLSVFIIICFYTWRRKIFQQGFQRAKRFIHKKQVGPRSYYQKKVIELEFKRKRKQIKMKNTRNDVKIFDLEGAQTAAVLLFKPSDTFFIQPEHSSVFPG